MSAPFDRLTRDDSMALKRYLGNFVSHDVVQNWRKQYFFTIEELNAMDRKDLARKWYEEDTRSVWKLRRWEEIISSFYHGDKEAFLNEVARYIDDRIPRAYLKYHGDGDTPAGNHVKCDENGNPVTGLIYHYQDNKSPQQYSPGATQKQINFLVDLASKKGFTLWPDGITKDEASTCIDYFLNMNSRPEPVCFQKYFKPRIEGEPNKKKLPDEIMIKIDWFAEREAKALADKFKSFATAVKRTDFSKTDPHNYHEPRDMIIDIAKGYDINYTKMDPCDDWYHISGSLKTGTWNLSYTISITVEYFDIPTEEIWQKMPLMVIEEFTSMPPEKLAMEIREQLIDSAKQKRKYNYIAASRKKSTTT